MSSQLAWAQEGGGSPGGAEGVLVAGAEGVLTWLQVCPLQPWAVLCLQKHFLKGGHWYIITWG